MKNPPGPSTAREESTLIEWGDKDTTAHQKDGCFYQIFPTMTSSVKGLNERILKGSSPAFQGFLWAEAPIQYNTGKA